MSGTARAVIGAVAVILLTVALLVMAVRSDAPRQGVNRVATLDPGYTRTIIDLGLAERLVGVATIDPAHDHALSTGELPAALPRLGSYLDLDLERLAALETTHVFGRFEPIPLDLEDVDRRTRRVADEFGVEVPDRLLLATEDECVDDAATSEFNVATAPEVRFLIAFGLDPLRVMGGETVFSRGLIDRHAGWINAAGSYDTGAPELDAELLASLSVDVIVHLVSGPKAPAAEVEPHRGVRVIRVSDPEALLVSTNLHRTFAAMDEAVALFQTADADSKP